MGQNYYVLRLWCIVITKNSNRHLDQVQLVALSKNLLIHKCIFEFKSARKEVREPYTTKTYHLWDFLSQQRKWQMGVNHCRSATNVWLWVSQRRPPGSKYQGVGLPSQATFQLEAQEDEVLVLHTRVSISVGTSARFSGGKRQFPDGQHDKKRCRHHTQWTNRWLQPSNPCETLVFRNNILVSRHLYSASFTDT